MSTGEGGDGDVVVGDDGAAACTCCRYGSVAGGDQFVIEQGISGGAVSLELGDHVGERLQLFRDIFPRLDFGDVDFCLLCQVVDLRLLSGEQLPDNRFGIES